MVCWCLAVFPSGTAGVAELGPPRVWNDYGVRHLAVKGELGVGRAEHVEPGRFACLVAKGRVNQAMAERLERSAGLRVLKPFTRGGSYFIYAAQLLQPAEQQGDNHQRKDD